MGPCKPMYIKLTTKNTKKLHKGLRENRIGNYSYNLVKQLFATFV